MPSKKVASSKKPNVKDSPSLGRRTYQVTLPPYLADLLEIFASQEFRTPAQEIGFILRAALDPEGRAEDTAMSGGFLGAAREDMAARVRQNRGQAVPPGALMAQAGVVPAAPPQPVGPPKFTPFENMERPPEGPVRELRMAGMEGDGGAVAWMDYPPDKVVMSKIVRIAAESIRDFMGSISYRNKEYSPIGEYCERLPGGQWQSWAYFTHTAGGI